MGFKCPICKEDFGIDKSKWEKHISTEHLGTGAECVKVLKNATGDVKKDKV